MFLFSDLFSVNNGDMEDSGSSGIIETMVTCMLVNDAIKREVERQEMIRRDPMSEFRP